MSQRDDLEATYVAERERLVQQLKRMFPSLTIHECEDLVQLAFVAALLECGKPDFELRQSWLAWLRAVARFRALDYLREREACSLDAMLRHTASDGDSQAAPFDPKQPGLTPSQVLQQAERGQRRRVLVSDLLADYVRHVERYDMSLQREVFERSLRGQSPADAAADMRLPRQQVYDHRSRAFDWIRRQVAERDAQGSVLATLLSPAAPAEDDDQSRPHRLPDVLRLAIDELGALCPSDTRLVTYRDRPDADDVAEVRYHIHHSRWYLDIRPHEPGCRLCQARCLEL